LNNAAHVAFARVLVKWHGGCFLKEFVTHLLRPKEALVITYQAPIQHRDLNTLFSNARHFKSMHAVNEFSRDGNDAFSIRSVLVPLDGTNLGEHALPYALSVVKRTGAVLHLVHADSRLDNVEPWQMMLSDDAVARRVGAKRQYLQDVARRIARKHDVEIKTLLIDMGSTGIGVNFAAEVVDLVVMASRRLSRFRSLWSLSVADEIRRQLDCPILLVEGSPAAADLQADPAMKHLLLPLDGAAGSERILVPAVAIGRTTDASMTLLNVQNRDVSRGRFEHSSPAGYLLGMAKMVRGKMPNVKAQMLVTSDNVCDAITDYALQHDVDLIGVTTENRHSLSRFLRGSLADALLRNTGVPILLLGPAPREESPKLLTVYPQFAEHGSN
jgi:nucleotide-binding universal stress UspA family protein